MSVREDIKDLKMQIRRSIDTGNKALLGDLIKQAVIFCEKIKETLKEADAETRAELSKEMADLKTFLSSETKRLSKKMGLTEDELVRYNENPENFSKEEWNALQIIKKNFAQKAKELRQIVRKPTSQKKLPASLDHLPPHLKEVLESNPNLVKITLPPKQGGKKKVVLKKVKKNKWVKS
jgi:alanyl-tRNA synthetase